MAKATTKQADENHRIGTNRGGDIILSGEKQLLAFMKETASQLESLTMLSNEIHDGSNLESGASTLLEVIQDMAWQLNQAVLQHLNSQEEVQHGG